MLWGRYQGATGVQGEMHQGVTGAYGDTGSTKCVGEMQQDVTDVTMYFVELIHLTRCVGKMHQGVTGVTNEHCGTYLLD